MPHPQNSDRKLQKTKIMNSILKIMYGTLIYSINIYDPYKLLE